MCEEYRVGWFKGFTAEIAKKYWTADTVIGLIIDANLSHRQCMQTHVIRAPLERPDVPSGRFVRVAFSAVLMYACAYAGGKNAGGFLPPLRQ
eukprot:1268810-Pleurochrysis_carterae.AAC.1